MARIAELSAENFGVTEDAPKYKGTMEPPVPAGDHEPEPAHA